MAVDDNERSGRVIAHFNTDSLASLSHYPANFGPALEEFSRHWPLKRGTPRPAPQARKRRAQRELSSEEYDPYAATPEDALVQGAYTAEILTPVGLTARAARYGAAVGR